MRGVVTVAMLVVIAIIAAAAAVILVVADPFTLPVGRGLSTGGW